MTQHRLVTALALAVLAPAALACGGMHELLFRCTTAKGKQIEVCDRGDIIGYSFGIPGKPEIHVGAKRDQVLSFQWQGISRYERYTVEVPNGNTTYRVYWTRDRESGKAPGMDAGVEVEVNLKTVAVVHCALDKPLTQGLKGVDFGVADAYPGGYAAGR